MSAGGGSPLMLFRRSDGGSPNPFSLHLPGESTHTEQGLTSANRSVVDMEEVGYRQPSRGRNTLDPSLPSRLVSGVIKERWCPGHESLQETPPPIGGIGTHSKFYRGRPRSILHRKMMARQAGAMGSRGGWVGLGSPI